MTLQIISNKMKPGFRKASVADIEQIWQIILQAKEQMRQRNSRQWQDGYPFEENIIKDVGKGDGYVLCFEHRIIAYAAVIFDKEPAYEKLNGKWLTNQPYIVVHRLAVADKMQQLGIASLFMQKVEELSRENQTYSFRVDTNFDNLYMQKLLAKQGFVYCGEVLYQENVRMAYEKVL